MGITVQSLQGLGDLGEGCRNSGGFLRSGYALELWDAKYSGKSKLFEGDSIGHYVGDYSWGY